MRWVLASLSEERNENNGGTGYYFTRQLHTLGNCLARIIDAVILLRNETQAQLNQLRPPAAEPEPVVLPAPPSAHTGIEAAPAVHPRMIDLRDIYDEDEAEAGNNDEDVPVTPPPTASSIKSSRYEFRPPNIGAYYQKQIPILLARNTAILGDIDPKQVTLHDKEREFHALQKALKASIREAKRLLKKVDALKPFNAFETYFKAIMGGFTIQTSSGEKHDLETISFNGGSKLGRRVGTLISLSKQAQTGHEASEVCSKWEQYNADLLSILEAYHQAIEQVEVAIQGVNMGMPQLNELNEALRIFVKDAPLNLGETEKALISGQAEVKAAWERYVKLVDEINNLAHQIEGMDPAKAIPYSTTLEAPSLDLCERLEAEKNRLFRRLDNVTLAHGEVHSLRSDIQGLEAQYEQANVYLGEALEVIKAAHAEAEEVYSKLDQKSETIVSAEVEKLRRAFTRIKADNEAYHGFCDEYQHKREAFNALVTEIEIIDSVIPLQEGGKKPVGHFSPMPNGLEQIDVNDLKREVSIIESDLNRKLSLEEVIALKGRVAQLGKDYLNRTVGILQDHITPLEHTTADAERHLEALRKYSTGSIVKGTPANKPSVIKLASTKG